jgi:hypothetical protein
MIWERVQAPSSFLRAGLFFWERTVLTETVHERRCLIDYERRSRALALRRKRRKEDEHGN